MRPRLIAEQLRWCIISAGGIYDGCNQTLVVDRRACPGVPRLPCHSQPLTSPKGEPTNAIFGFANILLKAINDYPPDYVILTLDAGRTFRHDAYAEYKATRAKMPDDLHVQIEHIGELAKRDGHPGIHQRGL